MILHLLDASRLEQAWQDYRDIRKELEAFSENVAKKDEVVVLTKIDLVSDEDLAELLKQAKKELPKKSVFALSAVAMLRIEVLKDFLIEKTEGKRKFLEDEAERLEAARIKSEEPVEKTYDLTSRRETTERVKIERAAPDTFVITGERIQQIVRMTEMRNPEAVARIYDILEKIGALRKVLTAIERDSDFKMRDSFFEGNADEIFEPKIVIEDRVFPLAKTLFSRRVEKK
jgi:GTP-binding protein